MATVTRARIRRLLGENTGFFFAGSLTTIGGAAGATTIDTKVARFNTNLLVGKWQVLTSGTSPAPGEAQRISTVSNSPTVGVITPVNVWSAQVASGVTYEIMEHDPTALDWALQEAGRTLAGRLWLLIRDETLVVDNLIANWDFENYSGSDFTSWTRIGTATVAQTTTRFIHGSNGCNLVGVSGDGIEQDIINAVGGIRQSIDQAVGKMLHVRGWSNVNGADLARLRVTFNGTTYTNGPYNGGDREWEGPSLQYINVAIPADPTEMTVSFEGSGTMAGTAVNCDAIVAWIDQLNRYIVPTTLYPYGPSKLSQQVYRAQPNGLYAPLGPEHPPQSGRILRMEGMGRITIPTTDSGTMEIDETQAELVVAEAAVHLFRRLANSEPGGRDRFRAEEAGWKAKVDDIERRNPGLARAAMSADRRTTWKTMEEASNLYLLLQGR